MVRGASVKVNATRVVDGDRGKAAAGEVVLADKTRVLVACGEGTVELVTVTPRGSGRCARPSG